MLRRLSYPLDANVPTFMHYSPPHIAPLQSIARRDNVNTSLYELHSNSGTHVIALATSMTRVRHQPNSRGAFPLHPPRDHRYRSADHVAHHRK